eukprot:874131_1
MPLKKKIKDFFQKSIDTLTQHKDKNKIRKEVLEEMQTEMEMAEQKQSLLPKSTAMSYETENKSEEKQYQVESDEYQVDYKISDSDESSSDEISHEDNIGLPKKRIRKKK